MGVTFTKTIRNSEFDVNDNTSNGSEVSEPNKHKLTSIDSKPNTNYDEVHLRSTTYIFTS